MLGESDVRSMHQSIEAGVTMGWHSFEQDIVSHFEAGRITEETSMLYSVNKPAMRQALDIARKRMGTQDETPHGFRLTEHTPKPVVAEPPPLPALKMAPAPAQPATQSRPGAPFVRT
jgi:hypothetical protein